MTGEPVPSPCTGVCTLDPKTDRCLGCRRSLDEIARWSVMSDHEKRVVWDALATREAPAP